MNKFCLVALGLALIALFILPNASAKRVKLEESVFNECLKETGTNKDDLYLAFLRNRYPEKEQKFTECYDDKKGWTQRRQKRETPQNEWHSLKLYVNECRFKYSGKETKEEMLKFKKCLF